MALASALARRRMYYGWYIVIGLFICSFFVVSLTAYAPAVFLKPMTQELGWSRGFFSTVVWLSMLISIPVAMVLWPRVDKHGPLGVMLVSTVILGAGAMALGFVQEQWHFILLKSIVMPFGTAGVGPMMVMLVVSNWFARRRGRALAITAMGMSLAGIAAPPMLTYLISVLGWRHAWMAAGLATLVLTLIPVALFMKRRPEDLGLLPDGNPGIPEAQQTKKPPPPVQDVTWTRREVLRTPAFWLISIAHPLGYLGLGVVTQHLVAYLTDPGMGFSSQKAALVLATIGLLSFTFKIPWGFIMERMSIKFCYAVSFVIFGAGMGLLVMAKANLAALFLATAILGIGMSAGTPLQGMVYVNYFGRTSQGMARSLATPIQAISGPLGPILAGFLWDVTGSYRGIFAFYAIPSVLGIVLVMFARPPKLPAPVAVPAKEPA